MRQSRRRSSLFASDLAWSKGCTCSGETYRLRFLRSDTLRYRLLVEGIEPCRSRLECGLSPLNRASVYEQLTRLLHFAEWKTNCQLKDSQSIGEGRSVRDEVEKRSVPCISENDLDFMSV